MSVTSGTSDMPTYESGSLPCAAGAYAARHDMFPPGGCVVVLVSGGADSTALLRLFAGGHLGDGSPGPSPHSSLSVLHVNHLLRGADSDADEAFVSTLCDELGIEFVAIRYDVADWARSAGLNLEDAGRRVRYRFAEEQLDAQCDRAAIARDHGRVAVAHTLDDRIETFFMRVLTGAGAQGLSSIAPVRGRIVRPLLDSSGDEIRAWLRSVGQDWREDATNADTQRFRALVRHELVPVAESVNPKFRQTLARTLDLLADDSVLLDEMAEAFAHDFAEVDSARGEVAFDRRAMLTLSRPMARRTVRAAILEVFPEVSRLESAHIEALVDGMAEDGFARDLPGGLRASSEYGRMLVAHPPEAPPVIPPGLLEVPGVVDLGEAGSIVAAETDPAQTAGTSDSVVVDVTGFEGALIVDSVRAGDRMRPLGMEGSRKLSDMLADAKVPRRDRLSTPVVRAGERIIWLAGVRMSDEFRVSPGTRRAIRLTWMRR